MGFPAQWLFMAGVVGGAVFGAVLSLIVQDLVRDVRARHRHAEWKKWCRRWDEPEDDEADQ